MILITGASRGIGKFLFEEFTKSGEEVHGTYYLENSELGKNHKYHQLDVTDFKIAEKLIKELSPSIKKFVLINCAGQQL
jgi:acetoacetyl-CoA reductase/3-oxoacyl-[acyl-carrier protein] reductase